jgi:hypothetical protein
VEGYVIEQWRNPEAIKIAQSDDDRMSRIRKITDEMRHLQEQKNEALRMKLRKEVDAKTFREVTAEIDAAHYQLTREHNKLTSEAAMPELPDPSLAWEDLSAEDRRALTEMLVDKIIVAPHPHKIVDGRRHYLIAPSHTKIPSKRRSDSRQCTTRGSRSFPGSERTTRAIDSARLGGKRLIHRPLTGRNYGSSAKQNVWPSNCGCGPWIAATDPSGLKTICPASCWTIPAGPWMCTVSPTVRAVPSG